MKRYGKDTYLLTTETETVVVDNVTEAAAIARAKRHAVKTDTSVDLWFRVVDCHSYEAYVGTASPFMGGSFSRNDLRA